MNIILDKQSTTDGLIKITLTESDYQPKVEEKVKDYSRKANIKGFRQGKVPSGVIRKMFGKSILVEEVNHLISHSVSDYIKDNKIRILGDPIPNATTPIDWDNQKDFEFEFKIGLVDDFTVELSQKVKVKSHPIEVDQKVIDETLTDIQKRYGKVSYPETSESQDVLFGEIVAINGNRPDGDKHSSYIPIEKVEKKVQSRFTGLKKEDEVEFEVDKTFTDETAIAQAINVSEEQAKAATGKYTLKISTISRTEPSGLNEELFDKVFGKGAVKNEAEFVSKVKETITENYNRETDHLLDHEIQHYFVDHTKINMPESFLKTWLKATSDGKVTDEMLEKEFNDYKNSLKWDLIKNKIAEDKAIKVETDEVKVKAREMITAQFGGQGFAEQLGERMDAIVDNYLSGQEGKNFLNLYNQLRTEKIMKAIKEIISVNEKKVSLEEFRKIAAEHRH